MKYLCPRDLRRGEMEEKMKESRIIFVSRRMESMSFLI